VEWNEKNSRGRLKRSAQLHERALPIAAFNIGGDARSNSRLDGTHAHARPSPGPRADIT